MLAKKIGGRLSKEVRAASFLARRSRACERFEEDEPWIVTCAQFMYISRLPILLNHVQANRASPLGASEGILKSYFLVIGHPPSMDLITLNDFPLS